MRETAFKAEMIKMFVAYNKPVTDKMVSAKAVLLAEALHFLPMDKIRPFFNHVRSSEDIFPSDAKLSKLLNVFMQRFPVEPPKQDTTGSEYPTTEQHQKAMQTIIAVLDGKIDKAQGHELLAGIFAGEV